MIKLINIVKHYQAGEVNHVALQDIHVSIEETEMVAIIGASGSGKTTLMNIIGLLDKPTSGEYWLQGENVSLASQKSLAKIRNHQIGFVFQAFFLLPRFNALQNVSLPLTYRELPKEEVQQLAIHALQRVGIEHLAYRYPRELSGGQQQRVAIARALATKPTVLLADEPTGALDSKIGQEIMDLFIQLNQLDKNTIILITHDAKIAAQCPRIIRIQDGRIIEDAGAKK